MSYLNYPRLHFSGLFSAAPSTINNTPNNYNSNVYYHATSRNQENAGDLKNSTNPEQLDQVELYWNPYGSGIYDLKDCVVTKVVYGPEDEATTAAKDAIIGQSVAAIYTKAAPKLVDLDPMQQNASEIWGMNLQIAGRSAANPNSIADHIGGTFVPAPFNPIRVQSQNGPRSSASGSALYQGQLNNLKINNEGRQSKFINQLADAPPSALSLNFSVNAHNNIPQVYSFNAGSLLAIRAAGVPGSVISKLYPLTQMIQNTGGTQGDVPTESFVTHELKRLLGPSDNRKYKDRILELTKQSYNPGMPHGFLFGEMAGTLGLSDVAQPSFFVASRMMAPYDKTSKVYFAAFDVEYSCDDTAYVSVNLSNSLITDLPGSVAFSQQLGDLNLVYLDPNATDPLGSAIHLGDIDYQGSAFKTQQAGFYVCKVCGTDAEKIKNRPLGIVSTIDKVKILLLAENNEGYFMRNDQFIYRMNSSQATGADQPYGNTATADVYVYQFGQPVSKNQKISIQLNAKSPQEALNYTVNTLGTSGTAGIGNLSMPETALVIKEATAIVDNGLASFDISAFDPGNPRGYVDGQVYFLDYTFVDTNIAQDYVSDPNDIISILVFQDKLKGGGEALNYVPTWNGEIADILSQYGKLYPFMSHFGLDDYDSVKQHAGRIRSVLTKPLICSLHMPVVRDLSYDRLQLILKWMDNDMPLN